MSHQQVQSVDLPEHVVDRVEKRLPRTEFDSAAEYITFVLEEVLYHVEEQTDESAPDPVDEEEVKSRLESLGYLDN